MKLNLAGKELLEIEVVRGVGGDCLVMNETRVAGPKPLGGGTVVNHWYVPIAKVATLLKSVPQEDK